MVDDLRIRVSELCMAEGRVHSPPWRRLAAHRPMLALCSQAEALRDRVLFWTRDLYSIDIAH